MAMMPSEKQSRPILWRTGREIFFVMPYGCNHRPDESLRVVVVVAVTAATEIIGMYCTSAMGDFQRHKI
jgi:hypothetical protein